MPAPKVSPVVREDIQDIYLYGVLTFGLRQADAYLAALEDTLMLIGEHPKFGRERDEVRPPIRLVRYEAHHVFYDLVDGAPVIQRVLHHSADWANVL